MEFLEGTDLAGELERAGGALSLPVVAEYIVQACDAMAEAHALGIVHRDLKPANLFLTRRADGSPLVKVLDFGISKANPLTDSNGALQMTKTTAILGSPLYMSPEQMKSSRNVDMRTDVWSLGVILYEALGGRAPFNSETLGGLMAMVMTEPHAPLENVRPDLPRDVCMLVNRCLAKDPSFRPANVAELARGLAPYCPPRALPIVERVSTVIGGAPLAAGGPPAAGPTAHTGTVVAAGTPAPFAMMQQSPVASAISGQSAPSPSWGSTGSPAPKRSSSAAIWVVLGLLVVGGAVAVAVVVAIQKQARAVADGVGGASATATATSSAAAATASTPSPPVVVLAPSEPTASASETPSATTGRNPTTTLVPPLLPTAGRPSTRGTPPAVSATTKPLATATATQTAPAPQKPGILDTSN
jgi:serine/threonine-protein kinase